MTYEKFISRKTIPMNCKFCGEKIYYHTNEYGSKVFFEELGGNWPIHECKSYLLAKSAEKFPNSCIPLNKPKAILIKKNVS